MAKSSLMDPFRNAFLVFSLLHLVFACELLWYESGANTPDALTRRAEQQDSVVHRWTEIMACTRSNGHFDGCEKSVCRPRQ